MCSNNLGCIPRSRLLQQPGGPPRVPDPLQCSLHGAFRQIQARRNVFDRESLDAKVDTARSLGSSKLSKCSTCSCVIAAASDGGTLEPRRSRSSGFVTRA